MTDPLEIATGARVGTSGAAETLPRRLRWPALALLIVAWNAPIAGMAGFQQLSIAFGNGVGAPISFLVAGAILLLFVVGFLRMSAYVKNPGAFYCYIVEGLGRSLGLAGAVVATAAYVLFAAGTYVYAGLIVVDMTHQIFGTALLNWQIWSFVTLVVVTGLGLLRIDLSMRVIGTLVVVEILLVAAWQAAVILQGGPEGYSASSWTPHEFFTGTVGLGVLFAMLTMIGFEGGACFRDETMNPERTVRRATVGAIVFMAIFYGVGAWVYIVTQGPSKVVGAATSDPVGSFFGSVETYLGGFFSKLVSVVLVTSIVAANIAIQGNGSRYLFALGRDGVLPPAVAKVHPRLESPWVAVLGIASFSLVALVIVTSGGMDPVKAYAALTGAGIYFILPLLVTTSVAIVVYFRRHRDLSPGVWAAMIAPLVSAVGLVTLFVFATRDLEVLTITTNAKYAAIAALMAVAALGYAVARWNKAHRPEVYERIGNQ